MYNHIYEHGGNPNQISLMGHSAVVGIVTTIGTNQTFLQEHSLNLSMLKHNIYLDTESYDIRNQIENEIKIQSMLYMNVFGINPLVWDASPKSRLISV